MATITSNLLGKIGAAVLPYLYTVGALFFKHIKPDGSGFDTTSIETELTGILEGPEGPNVPAALKPFEGFAVKLAVDATAGFLAKLGVVKALESLMGKLEADVKALDLSQPASGSSPASAPQPPVEA